MPLENISEKQNSSKVDEIEVIDGMLAEIARLQEEGRDSFKKIESRSSEVQSEIVQILLNDHKFSSVESEKLERFALDCWRGIEMFYMFQYAVDVHGHSKSQLRKRINKFREGVEQLLSQLPWEGGVIEASVSDPFLKGLMIFSGSCCESSDLYDFRGKLEAYLKASERMLQDLDKLAQITKSYKEDLVYTFASAYRLAFGEWPASSTGNNRRGKTYSFKRIIDIAFNIIYCTDASNKVFVAGLNPDNKIARKNKFKKYQWVLHP